MPKSAGLHYFVREAKDCNPQRPPIILIHGAGGTYLSWPPQIRRLAGEKIYAPDLPGHGQSEGTGRRSIEEYAGAVINFMDAENIQDAALAGISMGSAIALMLALKHPKRMAGLVLIGGGAKMPVAKNTLETIGNPDTFDAAVEFVNSSFFSPTASPDLIRLSRQGLLKTDPSVLLGDFLACNQFDATSRLSEIRIPTLVLCGEKDKMMPPKFSGFLRDSVSNARLHLVPSAGHMLQLEKPDIVADLLKKFMDEFALPSAP
ncbi:MAG: alpha/beta hydrolase [Anaerolineales bacterium]|nr:MAG: alpha/beta hydrolase [Anaerolineales bacterium]